jgi:putative spermidine/putrescine transport system permease protein
MTAKIMCVIVLLFLIVPILILIPVSLSPTSFVVFPNESYSLKWYQDLFADPGWMTAIANSLKIGVLTTVCAMLLGIAASLGIRSMGRKASIFFGEYFRLPQTIPIIVSAISVFALLNSLHLVGTLAGLTVAHTLIALPFVVTTITAGLFGINENFEMAAVSLGANRIQAFFHILLPMLRPSIASASLFAFLTSFDEIAVTLFITGPMVETLPMKMYNGISQNIKPTLAAVSSILVMALVIGFAVATVLQFRALKRKPSQEI